MIVGSYTENAFDKLNNGIGIVDIEGKNVIKTKNPSFLYSCGNILYSVNELKYGKISYYDRYTKLGEKSTYGEYPCHLNICNNMLIICNYGGNVSIYNLNQDGIPIDLVKVISFQHNSNSNNLSHPHSSYYVGNDVLIISDLGHDSLYCLDINSLEIIYVVRMETGSGPRHMVRRDNYLYVSNELSSSISVINITNWSIIKNYKTPSPGQPSHIDIYKGKLYMANRVCNEMIIYLVGDNGDLILDQQIYLNGKSPRHFTIYQDVLYVACQDSNIIDVYDINKVLEHREIIKIQTPTFILFV